MGTGQCRKNKRFFFVRVEKRRPVACEATTLTIRLHASHRMASVQTACNCLFSLTSQLVCTSPVCIARRHFMYLAITQTCDVDLTRLPSKQELRGLRTRKPLAYRESTCTNLSVSCPYEIIVYSVLKHINTARMHTISRQFIPLIYRSLGKRILSKIQPILPFH